MRFIEHGPDIPDELLLALDEERVMFFCGAGVSQENAKLPSFMGLTKIVLAKIGVLPSEPAYKIFKHINKIKNRAHISGLIPVDRVFSALEKSNLKKREIEAIVAKALIPPKPPPPLKKFSLTAHRILLNLSTTKDKRTRLITTNFDRLFEKTRKRDGAKKLTTWQRPGFPNSSQIKTFEGIVYLHGMVNENDNGSDNGFVLSSASFGEAYLNEGSATRFFKEIISEYTVVFVGYGADDPPVHYLLEALGESGKKPDNIYAFQTRTQKEAAKKITKEKIAEKWQNKYVHAIVYDEEYGGSHRQLWETLRLWALRAKNLVGWQDKIIAMAQKGPEKLLPFQREQVMHLVSTLKGAQRFCASDNPPPATWLCVFDSARRLVVPTTMLQENGDEIKIAPFERYGLAMDPDPKNITPKDYIWDAFEINDQDKLEEQGNFIVQMKGHYALSVGELPKRLEHLGAWLARVSDQHAALWWAVRQVGIHWLVQEKIRGFLCDETNTAPSIGLAWHYLFDSWRPKADDRNALKSGWNLFEEDLNRFGWGMLMVRRYEELTKPQMVLRPGYYKEVIAPKKNDKTDATRLVRLKVLYNKNIYGIKIPDEWLGALTAVWKRNLDTAIRLEKEQGHYFSIRPLIIPTDGQDTSGIRASDNLTNIVFYYKSLLERLLISDSKQAKVESDAWDKEDNNVYARLRIWACQFPELVPNKELGQFFATMSRYFFWNSAHQHDLLFTLKTCWSRMPVPAKRAIEKLLLQGYEKPEGQEEQKYILYRARRVLLRLVWLKENDCVLDIDYDKEMALLQKDDPQFKPEYTKSVDRSTDGRVHRVISKTDPSVLCGLPFSEILDKSEKEINRHDDFSVEHDPFSGLCKVQPVRALAVLRYEAKQGNHRPWAWHKFLDSQKRKNDSVRFRRFIAEVLVGIPDKLIVELIQTLAWWLLSESEKLTPICVPVFEKLIKQIIKVMNKNHANKDAFITIRNGEPLSFNGVLNSNVGIITEALLSNPPIKNVKVGQIFPSNWKDIAEDMLNLPDDLGRHALVIFTFRLGWFYAIDPQWTHDNLLQPLFEGNPDTADAWWAGYLSGIRYLPTPELFKKIKPYLLARASNKDSQIKDDTPAMSQFILSNWSVDGEQRISDKEFHKILLDTGDDFHSRILWNIESFCEQDANPPYWKNKRLRLLEKVWPRDDLVLSPQISERLIKLAFADESAFPRLAKAILPLLGEITQGHMSLPYGEDKNSIIDKHSEAVLAILYKVLSESANQWPYKIEDTLDRIATVDPELKQDPRFKELQRRWAAR